jgi:hypothetical protein
MRSPAPSSRLASSEPTTSSMEGPHWGVGDRHPDVADPRDAGWGRVSRGPELRHADSTPFHGARDPLPVHDPLAGQPPRGRRQSLARPRPRQQLAGVSRTSGSASARRSTSTGRAERSSTRRTVKKVHKEAKRNVEARDRDPPDLRPGREGPRGADCRAPVSRSPTTTSRSRRRHAHRDVLRS